MGFLPDTDTAQSLAAPSTERDGAGRADWLRLFPGPHTPLLTSTLPRPATASPRADGQEEHPSPSPPDAASPSKSIVRRSRVRETLPSGLASADGPRLKSGPWQETTRRGRFQAPKMALPALRAIRGIAR